MTTNARRKGNGLIESLICLSVIFTYEFLLAKVHVGLPKGERTIFISVIWTTLWTRALDRKGNAAVTFGLQTPAPTTNATSNRRAYPHTAP